MEPRARPGSGKPRQPRLRRRSLGSRGERGHLMALEAAFVGMLLMTSVAFVLLLEVPPPRLNASRGPMEDLARGLLANLHRIDGNDAYASQLERIVAKAVQGNTSAFERVVARTLPPGAECRLFLENGHSRRLLAGPAERMARESVSSAHLWRPEWAYAFVVPSLDVVGDAQPLALQGYGVAQGALVKEHGVPVLATVTTTAGQYDRAGIAAIRDAPTASLWMLDEAGQAALHHTDPGLGVVDTTVHSVTATGPLPSPRTFTVPANQTSLDVRSRFTGTLVSVTMTFTSPLGVPFVLPATGVGTVWANLTIPLATPGLWTVSTAGSVTGDLLTPASSNLTVVAQRSSLQSNWTFVLREESGKPLPVGTNLTIRFPGTFTGLEQTATVQPGWRNVQAQLSLEEGFAVRAELATPLAGGERTFTAVGHRPATSDALYVVRAELGNGTHAKATVLLGKAGGTTSTPNEVQRGAYLTLPKPQAPGSTATWGLAFAAPATGVGLPETITRVDLRTADGAALWTNASGLIPATGWSLLGPGHVRWEGSVPVEANRAATFAARLTAAQTTTPHEGTHHLPVAFPGNAMFPSQDQDRPHVHSVQVPPPQDATGQPQRGYHQPAPGGGGASKGMANATVDWFVRGVRAHGDVPYEVSAFLPLTAAEQALRLGLARSHLGLSQQSARIGDRVEVQVDLQGLLDAAGGVAGVSAWNTRISIFDPAQPFVPRSQMQPSWRGSFGADLTLLPEASNVGAVAAWPLKASEVRSAVSANATFEVPRDAFYGPHAVLAETSFVVGDGLGNNMLQTARLLAVIDVIPDGGQGGTALYWANLECWLPDW
jgi:hypothetical protein